MSNVLNHLRPDNSVLLVVDVQEKLLPAIHEADSVVEYARRMIEAAKVLSVPILAAEQYPQGLGPTCATLREAFAPVKPVEKTLFSGCVAGITEGLKELGRPNVIVVGIEAHVCVQQTVLDLLRLGYTPFVCADAVGSRRPLDRDTAVARMRQGGAVVTTTESATFELLGEACTDAFKKILKIVK
ncbi:MAG TPA: hydrolase [Phycisphaerae bacterium]|nr:hydrolase [Phycisphaerae bacterium]